MELIDYLKRFKDDEAGLVAFAEAVGTTVGHLRNVAYKMRVASASLAAQVTLKTDGLVPVQVLRPKDWHLIWDPHIVAAGQTATPDGCPELVANGDGSTNPPEAAHAGA